MNSHTVPRKLLELFTYADSCTMSRRLWRYSKGNPPWRGVSPRTATRIDRHFADPADAEREAQLEQRLNAEFEDPVHKFIDQMSLRTFVLSRTHIRQLTRYISLLFNRSVARRMATKEHIRIIIESVKALLANEDRLVRIAAHWTIEYIRQGNGTEAFTAEHVRHNLNELMLRVASREHEQTTYVNSIENAMAYLDDKMDAGEWTILNTTIDDPFVIGDAPVVTWERDERNFMIYGLGFSRPNVEVLLPISPTACLHILPLVPRTRAVIVPAAREINEAQAAFSSAYCFAHVNSEALDAALKPKFHTARIGFNAFSVRHRNYSDTMFELLMSGGSRFDAPRL